VAVNGYILDPRLSSVRSATASNFGKEREGASPATLMKSTPRAISIDPAMCVSVASLGADDVPSEGGGPHGSEMVHVWPSLCVAVLTEIS
jgi:hypothetical protein